LYPDETEEDDNDALLEELGVHEKIEEKAGYEDDDDFYDSV